MIEPPLLLQSLRKQGVSFFTGVPDSLLKDICAHITAVLPPQQHIIASNEACAVGLAIGHYLATKHPALVYLQNSGLGNVVNPVTSLADPEVYAIPMLIMVGWRGEIMPDGEQMADEPQHRKQGRVTLDQLKVLNIPYRVINADTNGIEALIGGLLAQAVARSGPVALVVRKGTFSACAGEGLKQSPLLPTREQAIKSVLGAIDDNAAVVSTTGKASREVFELRRDNAQGHHRDFLTVGGMGQASQIAAGIAIADPQRQVVCIDGDGAALMHLGGLATSADCDNLLHVLINNEAHESVGGQPTKGNVLDFSRIAVDMGYRHAERVDSLARLESVLARYATLRGSRFVEVRCKLGSRGDLGRPDRSPVENKLDFMQFLGATNDG